MPDRRNIAMTERHHLRTVAASVTEESSSSLAARFSAIRETTRRLAAPLSAEDCALQSMPDASPVKWHLAHTSWFFETFLLEPHLADYRAHQPGFRVLFNSYYNAVGDKHPRAQRGLISRPAHDEVLAYRAHVNASMMQLLDREGGDESVRRLVELGLQHEQQHQELILTDVLHLLSRNPLKPSYLSANAHSGSTESAAPSLDWIAFAAGVVDVGHEGKAFAFDNELPRHREYLNAFALASRPVTNGEYLAFMADGGYGRPELWLSEGWDWVRNHGVEAPYYWERSAAQPARGERDAGQWQQFTLYGLHPLDLAAPVCHVSMFEADAYARWAGARLPREAEWEVAASQLASLGLIDGHFVEDAILRPLPSQEHGVGLSQMFGDVWEWTQSAYSPYPGYRAAEGAIGEYNGKFMCNQYVLRGGSFATPRTHIRTTYRNFFPASSRWQFTGLRLARDAD
jgi:ergothioneine biosynthesis protein EgtB